MCGQRHRLCVSAPIHFALTHMCLPNLVSPLACMLAFYPFALPTQAPAPKNPPAPVPAFTHVFVVVLHVFVCIVLNPTVLYLFKHVNSPKTVLPWSFPSEASATTNWTSPNISSLVAGSRLVALSNRCRRSIQKCMVPRANQGMVLNSKDLAWALGTFSRRLSLSSNWSQNQSPRLVSSGGGFSRGCGICLPVVPKNMFTRLSSPRIREVIDVVWFVGHPLNVLFHPPANEVEPVQRSQLNGLVMVEPNNAGNC